jgi:DNA-binding winged helix-turn-helix (wHTH) protein/TolB-like protein
MSLPVQHLYEFGPFVLDAGERVLRREGQPVALAPKALDTLLVLIEKNGRIVEKDELMNRVWPDSFVEEGNLAFNISVLRKTLAESGADVQFIETVPKRGYRFVATVRELNETPDLLLQRQTVSRIVIEEQRESPVEGPAKLPAPTSSSTLLRPLTSNRRLWAICGIFLGLMVVVGAAVYFRFSTAFGARSGVRTIAVLPFKPLAANAGDEYLELGMADALITRLSNLKQVIVRPTSSVLKYTSAGGDAISAGHELGVDTVLDGSVQRSGDTIRVTVRLIRVSDGVPLWADKFDETFTNIFTVQDSISERMASALTLNMSGDERKLLTKRYTENVEAYQAYLKGRYYWNKWNGEGLRKSIEYFEHALEKDPHYALAYAGLSDSHNLLGYLGIAPPKEAFPRSEATALKALEMDDSLSQAHLSLAKVSLFYNWDGPGFERELKRALDLDPNSGDAHGMYGTYLLAIGRFDESIAERKRSQELDPISPLFTTAVGWSYFYARRYDDAIDWYKRAIELDPGFVAAQNGLATVYELKGMHAEAVDAFLKAKALTGSKPESLEALKRAYAAGGIKGYWRKELELANEELKVSTVGTQRMATIYTELGDRDHAVEWLEKGYEERNSLLIFINVIPTFDSLHSHPGFVDLVRRIGLH